MREHEIHQLGKELEVIVANGEMQLRLNGGNTFMRAPFVLAEEELTHIRSAYYELESLATRPGKVRQYKQSEAQLGRWLAEILFRSMPTRGNQLDTVLDHCLLGLRENEYVRILLSFGCPVHAGLPWELALWTHPETGEELYLGHDRRIAMSRLDRGRSSIRLRRPLDVHRPLSILNIGADESRVGLRHYDLTCEFFRLINDHVPRVHTISRRSSELRQYWWDSAEIAGECFDFDIVQWRGHGSGRVLAAPTHAAECVEIDATELVQRTRGAFLYVVLACESGGRISTGGEAGASNFSSALLDAGAPAVIGVHDTLNQEEFGCLPILYPLLLQGLPLDYCIQYMRRLFAQRNTDGNRGPRVPWHKLSLRTASTWYLDSPPAMASMARSGKPAPGVVPLLRRFERLLEEQARQWPARSGKPAGALRRAIQRRR